MISERIDKRDKRTSFIKVGVLLKLCRPLLIKKRTMYTLSLHSFVILAAIISSIRGAYDIAIYGATPGGIAAAITAAQAAPSFSIVLIEPTANIGGMVSAGGIGLRDLGLEITSKFIISLLVFRYLLNNYSQRFSCTEMGK
jgi:NADPH-dependent 2,4-dienoyl-CoA reductase/sulfur reductase-like enzyme